MTNKDTVRKDRNERSREIAEHHFEQWSPEEIALLESCWGDEPIIDIAAVLGRTVEACRQMHYEIGQGRLRRARESRAEETKAAKRTDAWTRGFSSLAEMDAYYETLGR